MSDAVVEDLIVDLVRWLAARERTYEEAMAAWRTSCPRLPVWEEANDRGLIAHVKDEGRSLIRVTAAGFALLERKQTQENASLAQNDIESSTGGPSR